jgi:uncharacterized protein
LEEVPKEGEGLKFLGSAMVAQASSKEEVLEILKNDIYAKSEVWDFSKVSLNHSGGGNMRRCWAMVLI